MISLVPIAYRLFSDNSEIPFEEVYSRLIFQALNSFLLLLLWLLHPLVYWKARVHGLGDGLWEEVLFCHVELRDASQAIGLCGKHLYPLYHLICPGQTFLPRWLPSITKAESRTFPFPDHIWSVIFLPLLSSFLPFTRAQYGSLASLNSLGWPKAQGELREIHLPLPSAGVKGACHHVWPWSSLIFSLLVIVETPHLSIPDILLSLWCASHY